MKKFLVGTLLVLLTFVGVALLGAQGVEHSRGNLFSNLLFSPDNTYDIGASGATRPRTIYVGTSITSPNYVAATPSAGFIFSGFGRVAAQSDGVFTLQNNATTDFSRLQFGGTTSAFPALKRNGTRIDFRLADDSGDASVAASSFVAVTNLTNGTSGRIVVHMAAPTISSGFGTTPSIAASNGTAAFTVNVGTGGVATSGVIGLPTATTGWNCFVDDRTTNIVTRMTATTTTTATITAASAWAASDILSVSCFAY